MALLAQAWRRREPYTFWIMVSGAVLTDWAIVSQVSKDCPISTRTITQRFTKEYIPAAPHWSRQEGFPGSGSSVFRFRLCSLANCAARRILASALALCEWTDDGQHDLLTAIALPHHVEPDEKESEAHEQVKRAH